jgi:hypothetical protein
MRSATLERRDGKLIGERFKPRGKKFGLQPAILGID